jgi:integrase
MGNVYEIKGKKKNTWYISYYYKGRRIREAISEKKSEARAALATREADILRGKFEFKKDKKVWFEDFAEEYIEYQKVNKRSWGRDESSLKHLIPFFKDNLLSQIAPKDIEDYKKKRLEKVKPGTINRELQCLRHMFTIAEKFEEFDGKNPVKEVKLFKPREYVLRILQPKEIQKLLNVTDGYLRAIITIAVHTGMRKGEVLSLLWSDIDFGKSYVLIRETKSGHMRKVPISPVVVHTLKSLKKEGEFVFQSDKTDTRRRDFFRAWKAALERAEIKDFRFHDLRHTAASLMVANSVDLVTIKEILGHSDIKMTMRYAHTTPEIKKKAVNVLAEAIGLEKSEKMVINWSYKDNGEDVKPLLSGSKN